MFGLALLTAGSCPVSWLPIADLIFLATLCNLAIIIIITIIIIIIIIITIIIIATLCNLATLPVLLIDDLGLVSPSLSSSCP